MDFDLFKKRLLEDKDFGPLPERVNRNSEMLTRLHQKDGSLATLEASMTSLTRSMQAVEKAQRLQAVSHAEIEQSLKALAEAKSETEQHYERRVRLMIAIIGAATTITAAVLALILG